MSAIFRNIDEVNVAIPVPLSLSFKTLEPSVKVIQENFLRPYIGKDQLTTILGWLSGTDSLTGSQQELVNLCRYAAAQMLIRENADVMNLSITQGGFTVNKTETKDVASANRIVLLKEQLNINFQRGMNSVLEFLETNANTFTAYATSDERRDRKKYFLNNPEDFNKGLLGIKINWPLFIAMQDVMATMEAKYILPALGASLFQDMKAKLSNSQPLGVYAPLLPLIQRSVSGFVFAQCVTSLNIKVGDTGVYMSSIRNANEPQQTTPAGNTNSLEYIHRSYAEERLKELSEHLLSNASTYPLFQSSTAYTNRDTSRIESNRKGVFYGTN